MTPRFLVAKYAPDLDRMEPRNIGVVLWSKGDMRARFLPDREAAVYVNDLPVYRRWVNFWTEAVAAESIEPRRGYPVPKKDIACLEALLTTQRGNYILSDAGELMQPLRKKEISLATDFIYREFVATKAEPTPKQDARGFAHKCQALLQEAGISLREDFRTHYPVDVDLFGVTQPVHFSYGFGNGHPNALFQRVHLNKEESITSSLLKLHSLLYKPTVIKSDSVRVLFRRSDISSEMAEKAVLQFGNECETIDVDSDATAAKSLKRLLQQAV